MKRKKRGTKFSRFALRFLICTAALFVLGIVALNSYESNLNIQYQKLENEMTKLESEIDGLNMKKQELVSFSRISSIATKKGYTYRQSSATATVVSVQEE